MTAVSEAPNLILKVLLTCGILAALIFALADILAGLLTKGYRFDSQSASELSASGAPTRPLVIPLNLAANLLLMAFAIGVWLSAHENWAMRLMAVFIAINALFSILGFAFFPLHPAEPANSQANRLNTISMAVSMFAFVLAIVFGAVANHNWFRTFSLGIILLYVVGTVVGLRLRGSPAQDGNTVSRVGVQERTMIYSWLLWLILQAIVLLRA